MPSRLVWTLIALPGIAVGLWATTDSGGARLRYAAFVARVLWEANFDEAKVPAFELPELLTFADGRAIADADAWARRRRELLATFTNEVYGRGPEMATAVEAEVFDRDPAALGGQAERVQLRLWPAGRSAPSVELLVWLPAARTGPVPVFVALNFWGNHTTHDDPTIALETGWMNYVPDRGIENHRATEESRGLSRARWPVRMLVDRGYGLATAFAGDFAADADEEEVGPNFGGEGALTTWSWGLRRIADHLVTLEGDIGPLLVLGHSRLGKAALWAGALDERFAAVFSNDSGCLGAALSRRRFGETLALLTDTFPHWLPPRFAARYAGREDHLPIDQHQLLALVAPRPLYVGSASEDQWADPRGEFLAAKEAARVYALLGAEGLPADEMPPADAPVHGGIGYHLRAGPHDLTAWDWARYLDFADQRVRAAAP